MLCIRNGGEMTKEEHQERHEILHKRLDELLADYILYSKGSTSHTIFDLVKWSYQQTQIPDHKPRTP